MSDERDALLEAAFADARQDIADDGFSADIAMRVDRSRRRVLIGRLGIAALLVAFEFILDAPLQSTVGGFTDVLAMQLFRIENELLAYALTPVNSIAGLLGMILLGAQFGWRRFAA